MTKLWAAGCWALPGLARSRQRPQARRERGTHPQPPPPTRPRLPRPRPPRDGRAPGRARGGRGSGRRPRQAGRRGRGARTDGSTEKSGKKSRRRFLPAAAVEGDLAALADALGFQGCAGWVWRRPRDLLLRRGRRPSTAGGCGPEGRRWHLPLSPGPNPPPLPGPTAGSDASWMSGPAWATLHPDPWPQGLDQYRSSPWPLKDSPLPPLHPPPPLSISPWPRWLQLVYFLKKSQCVRLALSRGNWALEKQFASPTPNTWPAPAMQYRWGKASDPGLPLGPSQSGPTPFPTCYHTPSQWHLFSKHIPPCPQLAFTHVFNHFINASIHSCKRLWSSPVCQGRERTK